jgi:tau tubulin kinase
VNPTQQQMKQEKTTYGRLRVLTAPPTSVANVHELAQDNNTGSPRDSENVPFQYDVKIVSGASENRKGQRRHRPNSGSSVNLQRLNSASATTRDHSITQFALIDDENVSALQNMTKGGGGLTLASQWKSQFDDSEETTDNEWKQEPTSPEHQRVQYIQQHHKEQHPHYHTLPNKHHHQSNNTDNAVHIKTSATQPQSLQNTPSQPNAPSHHHQQQQQKDMNQTREFYIQHRSRRDDQSLKLKLKKKKK